MKTACLTSISSKLFATPIISDTGLPLLTEHIFQTPPLFYLDPPRLLIFRLFAYYLELESYYIENMHSKYLVAVWFIVSC